MTDYASMLGLSVVPADHDASGGFARNYGGSLSASQVGDALRALRAQITEILDGNAEAYANRRAAVRLNPTNLRVISSIGRGDLNAYGLRERGEGQPIFEWYAPRANDGIRPFREGIFFIVNHSYGRGLDRNALRNGQRTMAIDPQTGHNPRRFFVGIRELLNPAAEPRPGRTEAARCSIHHFVSLRGDLVNSVSWDNRCLHGEGSNGQYPGLGVNDRSIGIEHEEWYAAPAGARRFREIEDHGPYNDAVYATDAFILKKLEIYTGKNFKNFLGVGDACRQKIYAREVGCFNHKDTSGHADPGGEYFLPPEYELRVTNFRSMPETADRAGAWERRTRIWYESIPTGTRISAYARIFEIAGRLRNYNLQTEIFDPSRTTGVITRPAPGVSGSYTAAAAERAATGSISAADRAARMTTTSRVALYDSAGTTSAAISTALARNTARLANITERAVTMPVIQNALGFDFAKGLWVNQTTENRTAGVSGSGGDGPEPTGDVNPTTVPNTGTTPAG